MNFITDNWLLSSIIIPLLDIGVVAYILYRSYLIIAETRALAIIKGLFIVVSITILSKMLKLETLTWILEIFLSVGAIAIIVMFQGELRRALMKMGSARLFKYYGESPSSYLDEIVYAAKNLSENRVGALIAFERGTGLKNYAQTGIMLDSIISYNLLVSIFHKESPLHDGVVIIKENRIVAASCYVTLIALKGLKKSHGTRHRAALGLSEQTDAVVLIISEETGDISISIDKRLRVVKIENLRDNLKRYLFQEEEDIEELANGKSWIQKFKGLFK